MSSKVARCRNLGLGLGCVSGESCSLDDFVCPSAGLETFASPTSMGDIREEAPSDNVPCRRGRAKYCGTEISDELVEASVVAFSELAPLLSVSGVGRFVGGFPIDEASYELFINACLLNALKTLLRLRLVAVDLAGVLSGGLVGGIAA